MAKTPCCAPEPLSGGNGPAQALPMTASELPRHEEVRVSASDFVMGDAFDEGYYADGETPLHQVKLCEYHIDVTTITNRQFAKFVTDTKYKTKAERDGNSAVFIHEFKGSDDDVIESLDVPWWLLVRDANWQQPGGPSTSIDALDDHPVVHISYNDALAYCHWSGRSLPTEAQWEYAARGGLREKRYPWGDEQTPDGKYMTNIWQGEFPNTNDALDGFKATAPAKSFEPNGFGLWQTVGNVWEWCSDWFSPNSYQRGSCNNPLGPKTGDKRVIRGGSYLCHVSYCNRYRVAARSSSDPESTASNIGFRTVK